MTADVSARTGRTDTDVKPARVDVDFLRNFLAGRDAPCPNCGYNLRDLTGDRCPECGQALILRIQLAEPKMAAFLTGLVGLSAGAGFSGLLLIYFFLIVWLKGISGAGAGWIWTDVIGLAVQGAALFVWLRLRARLRVMSAGSRWALALACWGLSMANLVWFTLTIT